MNSQHLTLTLLNHEEIEFMLMALETAKAHSPCAPVARFAGDTIRQINHAIAHPEQYQLKLARK